MNSSHDIEDKLHQAVSHATPNLLDNILSEVATQKGHVISMTEQQKTKKSKKWIPAVAAAAALAIVVGATAIVGNVFSTTQSTVSFDVNPSVELKVSSNNKVSKVNALNSEGTSILDDMNLKGTDLNVATNALIGSMVKNGYIDANANSVLVSIEDADATRAQQLQQQITQTTSSSLSNSSIDGAIITQIVAPTAEEVKLAKQYSISTGKTSLIQKIIQNNSLLTFQDLSGLSINELNLLASSQKVDLSGLSSTGHASDGDYIGTEKAKEIALAHAGISADQIIKQEVDFDFEHGRMVYEIDFKTASGEFEYDIDAISGEILNHQIETKNTPAINGLVSVDQAKEIALQHVGATAADVNFIKAELDEDDNRWYYDIEFYVGNVEHEFEIDAATGAILKYETSGNNTPAPPASSNHNNNNNNNQNNHNQGNHGNFIGEGRAKEIAFAHAGVSQPSVYELECELDEDNNRWHYDIEFKANGMEYEFEIDAVTGEIISFSSDED